MSFENEKNNSEIIEEAEIIEETEKLEYSTCGQCTYVGGGHLKNCPSLAGKKEIQCTLCEAFNGHATYCDEHPANKQEKERKKIKEEKEFSFSEPKKTSEEKPPIEEKAKTVELPERMEMEFKKLEKLILSVFSEKEINKKIANRMLDDYFAEMKFNYDNDKNLKNFDFAEDKNSLIAAISEKYSQSDIIIALSKLGYGFAKKEKNSVDYEKKEEEFIAELADSAAFTIFETINNDKDCRLIKLEGVYKGIIDSNIREKIEQYTDEIISKRFLGELKNGNQFDNFFKELLKKEGGALGKYYSRVLEINIGDVKRKSDIDIMKELDKQHKNDGKALLDAFIKYKKMEDKKTSTHFIGDTIKIIEKKLEAIKRREGVIYNSI